jgi:hypothetical protein
LTEYKNSSIKSAKGLLTRPLTQEALVINKSHKVTLTRENYEGPKWLGGPENYSQK